MDVAGSDCGPTLRYCPGVCLEKNKRFDSGYPVPESIFKPRISLKRRRYFKHSTCFG